MNVVVCVLTCVPENCFVAAEPVAKLVHCTVCDVGQLSDPDLGIFPNLVDGMFGTAAIWMSFSSCILAGRNSTHPHNVHAILMPVMFFISFQMQCNVTFFMR